jgi:hypothetical protein
MSKEIFAHTQEAMQAEIDNQKKEHEEAIAKLQAELAKAREHANVSMIIELIETRR